MLRQMQKAALMNRKPYAHRVNQNGTMDSICPHCFVTVGTSNWETDLKRMEAAHVCEPERLRFYEEERALALKRTSRGDSLQQVGAVGDIGQSSAGRAEKVV